MTIRLVDLDFAEDLWSWMQSDPTMNLDDASPRTCREFVAELWRRMDQGEKILGAYANLSGRWEPVAAVGYIVQAPWLTMFHGLCVSPAHRGHGVGTTVVQRCLDTWFASGVTKVAASYYAHNNAVHRLFTRCGAVIEGTRHGEAWQNGHPIPMTQIAIFPDAYAASFRKVG